ncbi:glycosyltransferase family 4 protein [Halomonas sediminis]
MQRLTLVVAGDPGQRTGGYLYDARVVNELRAQGWQVSVQGLEGRFPDADAIAEHELDQALGSLPDQARVVLDGLAMGALPEVVARHARRLDITALVHHPLCDESGLNETQRQRFKARELKGLSWVKRIIVTSAFTARRLEQLAATLPAIELARRHVVEPGVEGAPLNAFDPQNPTPRLLCVATLTERKGHDILVAALASLRDLDWRCDCIGSLDRDPAQVARVQQLIQQQGLQDRVQLRGECSANELNAAYAASDLFVLPSWYEGYGMVVTEALSRGIAVVTTQGGALADTLPQGAGWCLPPGDIDAFSQALRRWCESPELRRTLRDGAVQARETLSDWQAAGRGFAQALTDSLPEDGRFEADWLSLREALDGKSRSHRLTGLAHDWLERRPGTKRILDLGSGTGSNPRFLAPRLPGPQHWRLVDHDPGLLQQASAPQASIRDAASRPVMLTPQRRHLAPVDADLMDGVDLVTASALCDLVSMQWAKSLVEACRQRQQALLLTLSVSGDWHFLNHGGEAISDAEDAMVLGLFQAHQSRDKGLGAALGGRAPKLLVECLQQAGYRVEQASSPWCLAAGDRRFLPLARALVNGWHEAALAQAPHRKDMLKAWRDQRLAALGNGEVGIYVGHVDIFASPEGEH